MSPKEQKITSGRAAIASALSMISSGRDAHRAAGAVDHLDLVGEQLVDAVPDDRVGLAAADLHDRPGWVVPAWIRSSSLRGQLGVAELVEVLHDRSDSSLSARRQCRRPACLARQREPVAELLLEDARCARSCPASPWPTARPAAGSRTRRARRRTRRRRRPGCTPGRPPCGRRRSRPRPSACRRGPRSDAPCPGTARHMASPSSSVRCRRAPGRAPGRRRSVAPAGGTDTVKPSVPQRPRSPSSSRAFWKTPPDSATVSGRCVAVLRRRGRRPDRRPRGGTARRSPRRARRPEVARRRPAPPESGRSAPSGPSGRRRTGMPLRHSPRRGPGPPARWPPAPRSRPPAGRRSSADTASNSRPMLEVGTQPRPVSSWWRSTPQLVGGAGRAPAADPAPSRFPPPTDGPAPSGRAAAR